MTSGSNEESKEGSCLRIIYMHGKEKGCDEFGENEKKQLFSI